MSRLCPTLPLANVMLRSRNRACSVMVQSPRVRAALAFGRPHQRTRRWSSLGFAQGTRLVDLAQGGKLGMRRLVDDVRAGRDRERPAGVGFDLLDAGEREPAVE